MLPALRCADGAFAEWELVVQVSFAWGVDLVNVPGCVAENIVQDANGDVPVLGYINGSFDEATLATFRRMDPGSVRCTSSIALEAPMDLVANNFYGPTTGNGGMLVMRY